MNDILIPLDHLEEGFKKQGEHIDSLLESSQILFDTKKYSTSLTLSVLAHEEVAKLRVIRQHIKEKKGITKKEWIELTSGGSHREKLIQSSKYKEEHLHEISEEKIEAVRRLQKKLSDPIYSKKPLQPKSNTLDYRIMMKLDNLKQDSFYLNWKNSEWFSTNLKLSEKELQSLALVILMITKQYLNQTILHSRHPKIEVDESSESFKKYRDDPLLKKDHQYKKEMANLEFANAARTTLKILENY